MKNENNFTVSFVVDQSPAEVFQAINNVSGWWTENVEGHSQQIHDHFDVRFGDVHYSRQLLTEVIPDKKVVWRVTDSRLTFVHDQQEWTGTEIHFDITPHNGKTHLRFTHVGLVPPIACYAGCSSAWSQYISESLYQFINTGKGKPEPQAK